MCSIFVLLFYECVASQRIDCSASDKKHLIHAFKDLNGKPMSGYSLNNAAITFVDNTLWQLNSCQREKSSFKRFTGFAAKYNLTDNSVRHTHFKKVKYSYPTENPPLATKTRRRRYVSNSSLKKHYLPPQRFHCCMIYIFSRQLFVESGHQKYHRFAGRYIILCPTV